MRNGAIALELLANVEAFQQIDFSTVNDLDWVGDSAVALIDVHGAGVVIQDIFTGERRVVGRKGEGPGELSYPVAIGVQSPGSALLVADSRAQAVSLFDAETGEFRNSQPIRGMPLSIHGMRDSVAIMSWMPFMGDAGPMLGGVDLTDGALTPWFSYPEADEGLAKVVAETGSRFLATAGSEKGPFYVASGFEYRIVVFDSTGSVLTSVGRPDLEARFPTDRDVERQRKLLRETMASSGVQPPAGVLSEQLERYRTRQLPFFTQTGLASDGAGNLWVIRFPGDADSTSIDVFSSDGRLRQTLRVRDRALAMDFRDTLVAVLMQRASGEWAELESLDVYRVTQE